MLFDTETADPCVGDDLVLRTRPARWGVDSEYGRLTDVMVLPPPADGPSEHEHQLLLETLEDQGVRCHELPPSTSTARDAVLITPWGLLELQASYSPAAASPVRQAAAIAGVPWLGRLDGGRVQAGDVRIVRPGVVAIGWSGDLTDEAGARALARIFKARGWSALVTRFDPYFGHLGTLVTPIGRRRAMACLEALDPPFVNRLWMLGLELLPTTIGEVQTLGSNLLGLGDGRILSATANRRINRELARRGFRIEAIDAESLTRSCGGIERLIVPLARRPG